MADAADPSRTNLNNYDVSYCGRHVTVYCWSRTPCGSPKWDEAERLGRLLAERSFGVVTGGYGAGSMEAIVKGARSARIVDKTKRTPTVAFPFGLPTRTNDGSVPEGCGTASESVAIRGVLVPGQFPDRVLTGSTYLTESVDARNMQERLDILSRLTFAYVVLPGTLGSLTELMVVLQNSCLHPAGQSRPLILCWRDPWESVVRHICSTLGVQKDYEDCVRYVDSPEECVDTIEAEYELRLGKKNCPP